MNKKNYLGNILIILSAICFGLMPLFTKIAYSAGSNTYTVCLHRFVFASLGFGIIVLLSPKVSFKISTADLKRLILMSLFYSATPLLLYGSYTMLSSSLASSLHFTYPLWVILLMLVLFKEKLTKRQLVCTLLCFIGIALLYTPGKTEQILGMVMAVASGLTYASYVVTSGRSKFKIPVSVISFYVTLFASIELFIFCFIGGKITFDITKKALASELGLSLVSTIFALLLFQKGIKLIPEIRASLLSTFEPVTSVLIGLLFFHESLTLRLGIGIILIILSTIILVINKGDAS